MTFGFVSSSRLNITFLRTKNARGYREQRAIVFWHNIKKAKAHIASNYSTIIDNDNLR